MALEAGQQSSAFLYCCRPANGDVPLTDRQCKTGVPARSPLGYAGGDARACSLDIFLVRVSNRPKGEQRTAQGFSVAEALGATRTRKAH
jgi:hypothetical protein